MAGLEGMAGVQGGVIGGAVCIATSFAVEFDLRGSELLRRRHGRAPGRVRDLCLTEQYIAWGTGV
jgi:hypothetical protein